MKKMNKKMPVAAADLYYHVRPGYWTARDRVVDNPATTLVLMRVRSLGRHSDPQGLRNFDMIRCCRYRPMVTGNIDGFLAKRFMIPYA